MSGRSGRRIGSASQPEQTNRPRRRAIRCDPCDGARGTRTPDLLGAIQALSQLSYSPVMAAMAAGCRQFRRSVTAIVHPGAPIRGIVRPSDLPARWTKVWSGRVRFRRYRVSLGSTVSIMGLLDDAIREHLDLKRRRGADPAELERAEREALGPVRRKGDVATADYPGDADEAFDAEVDDVPAGSSPVAYDQAEHDDWDARGDDLAIHGAEPELEPEPPRRSRRSISDDEAEQDQPRGLAARFGLRGRRSEEDEPEELESDEPPPSDEEATRVHRSTDARADPNPASGRERDRRASHRRCSRRRRRGRGRARGDSRVPPGHAGARPALVRAASAARLRLRRLTPGRTGPRRIEPAASARAGPARMRLGVGYAVAAGCERAAAVDFAAPPRPAARTIPSAPIAESHQTQALFAPLTFFGSSAIPSAVFLLRLFEGD